MSSLLNVACDHCGATYSAKPEFAGRQGRCPGCGVAVRIPSVPTVINTVATRRAFREYRPDAELRSQLIFTGLALVLAMFIFGRDLRKPGGDRAKAGDESSNESRVATETEPQTQSLAIGYGAGKLPLGTIPIASTAEVSNWPAATRSLADSAPELQVPALPDIADFGGHVASTDRRSGGGAFDPLTDRLREAAGPSDGSVSASPATAGPDEGPAVKTLEDAMTLSKQLQKPILLLFFSERCYWCRKMQTETLVDRDVQMAMTRYVRVIVDDTCPSKGTLTTKYAVKGIPAYLVTDSTGEKIKSGSGFWSDPRKFLDWLNDPTIRQAFDSADARANSSEKSAAPSGTARKLRGA